MTLPMIALGKFVSIETQINQSIRMDKIFKMLVKNRAKRMPTNFSVGERIELKSPKKSQGPLKEFPISERNSQKSLRFW
jgi:hypothetical protein